MKKLSIIFLVALGLFVGMKTFAATCVPPPPASSYQTGSCDYHCAESTYSNQQYIYLTCVQKNLQAPQPHASTPKPTPTPTPVVTPPPAQTPSPTVQPAKTTQSPTQTSNPGMLGDVPTFSTQLIYSYDPVNGVSWQPAPDQTNFSTQSQVKDLNKQISDIRLALLLNFALTLLVLGILYYELIYKR